MNVNGYEIKPGAYLYRANLEGAYLEGAYLEGANLKGANLINANLTGASLEDANLKDAYLIDAYLKDAYLEDAYLKGANLKGANLTGASLEGANLEGANLEGANLTGASLEGANLTGAHLENANLEGANLRGAYLEGANLEGANVTGTILEKMNSQAIQTSIAGIDKYSDALKQLAETEKVELRAELEKKKKENFELVATACMKAYEEKYGSDVFPVDEHWVYMVAEYFGTGEGQTTCIMMTQATAGHKEDFDEEHKYMPITSKQHRAVRKFHEKFGTWMLYGLKFLSKEDFFTEYAYYIPPVMMKFSIAKCYKEFYTEVHYNFS